MTPTQLRSVRNTKGWSQTQAAARLGVSQPYLAMLERGQRRLTPRLAQRAMSVYRLPPTVVPPSPCVALDTVSPTTLAKELAALGYPGFAHLRPARRKPKNPAEVLLAALAQDELEARLVEALPWVLVEYPNLDRDWLVREAKLRDLQNRLGFVVTLARELAERRQENEKVQALRELEAQLERSRLARQETLCRHSLSQPELAWLAANRSDEAGCWNLLTDWTVDHLRYASPPPKAVA